LKRIFGHLTQHDGVIHPMSIMCTYDSNGSNNQKYHYAESDNVITVISND